MGILGVANRKKYFKKIGVNPKDVCDIAVSHTDKIKVAGSKDRGKFFEGYDAIKTKEKGLIVGLTTADCLPIAVFDPTEESVALIHAGWRGLKNGIIRKTIAKFKDRQNLEVFIGPHICQKHYEVKSDVSDVFKKYPEALLRKDDKTFLDLGLIAKKQITDMGVKESNIKSDPICNFENKNLFSYRRGDIKNRNLYLFGIPLDSSRR